MLHTDRWRGYDGLVELGFNKHLRINHGGNEFALGPNQSTESRAFGATLSTAWLNFRE
jgi:transposase